MNQTIEKYESKVRSYCRAFPATFKSASGSRIIDEKGRSYIDFFAGAGSLNYGHNHPVLKEALLDYVAHDGITHGLDLTTAAKVEFLEEFQHEILAKRKLEYKIMFPGPTGTNAVEAALKLARKVTGRTEVIAFTNAFHGMTLGSLALTGNGSKRAAAGVPLSGVSRMPFCGYMGDTMNTAEYLERVLSDRSSGVELPAAVIVETVQAEGGINTASYKWLRDIARITRRHGALFIVDDIQTGCGRTGNFFSFEGVDVQPDIVCLSKSLSGYGLPFALTLISPGLDVFAPGEHNGTFRGHNLAFVTAKAAISEFWRDEQFSRSVHDKARCVEQRLSRIADRWGARRKGRGFLQGIEFSDRRVAAAASAEAYKLGLVAETSGPSDEVLKMLAPLTISDADLTEGLDIYERAVERAVQKLKAPQLAPRSVHA